MVITNYIASFVIFVILIVPIILQHVLTYFAPIYNITHISLYGFYLILYSTIQILFSTLNNARVPKKSSELLATSDELPKTNIVIVGYKENDKYFKMCLESVKAIAESSIHVNKVIVVIDGNHPDDYYMVDIFQEILSGTYINFEMKQLTLDDCVVFSDCKYICVTQPHNGKRSAMKTAFDISNLLSNASATKVETVLCTDSDTVLDVKCVENMIYLFGDKSVGAVAGNLSIYTKHESVVSFLSHLRYWFAFNLERAYQSFNNNVLCVSGPIGMYRLTDLTESNLINNWANQTFLSQSCTYGDDRHLTNRLIAKGKKVIYTPAAKAETETPATLQRYYRQQTRWSKSAYREFFWALQNVQKTRIMMFVYLIYLLVFPFLVMGYLMYILWGGTFVDVELYVIVVALGSLGKTLYGVTCTKRIEYVLYMLYIIPYACVIFPSKIWALCNLKDTSWGSGVRKTGSKSAEVSTRRDMYFLYAWNAVMLSGFVYNTIMSITLIKSGHLQIPWVMIGIVLGYFVLWISLCVYVAYKKRFERKAGENNELRQNLPKMFSFLTL